MATAEATANGRVLRDSTDGLYVIGTLQSYGTEEYRPAGGGDARLFHRVRVMSAAGAGQIFSVSYYTAEEMLAAVAGTHPGEAIQLRVVVKPSKVGADGSVTLYYNGRL